MCRTDIPAYYSPRMRTVDARPKNFHFSMSTFSLSTFVKFVAISISGSEQEFVETQ